MRFAAIADDLTGAVELASLLVREGVPARVLTSRATAEDAAGLPALVFGLKVRTIAKARALAEVERALKLLRPLEPKQLFYKYCATFNSTPRGNIGPIADLLSQEAGSDFTGFCPAFPEVDRTVYRGHLFVADTLVSRSQKRFDPLTPMREPDLVRVLQAQTATRVGLVRSADYAAGPASVAERVAALKRAGIGYAICDATTRGRPEDAGRRHGRLAADDGRLVGRGLLSAALARARRDRSEGRACVAGRAGSRRGARRKLRGAHGRAAAGLWPPPPGAAARRGRAHDRRAGHRSRAVLGPRASARWPDRLRHDEPARPRRRRAGALRAKESRRAGRDRRSGALPKACARSASAASSSPAAKPRARSSIIWACAACRSAPTRRRGSRGPSRPGKTRSAFISSRGSSGRSRCSCRR